MTSNQKCWVNHTLLIRVANQYIQMSFGPPIINPPCLQSILSGKEKLTIICAHWAVVTTHSAATRVPVQPSKAAKPKPRINTMRQTQDSQSRFCTLNHSRGGLRRSKRRWILPKIRTFIWTYFWAADRLTDRQADRGHCGSKGSYISKNNQCLLYLKGYGFCLNCQLFADLTIWCKIEMD